MTSLVVISREQAVFEYHAPLRDMQFNLHEVFQISSRFADLDLNDELSEELINSVLEEAGKIAETLMAPLNQRGDELANLMLSKQRVNAVQSYLIKQGVPHTRLTATAFGEQQSVADSNNYEDNVFDRRVTLTTRPVSQSSLRTAQSNH